MNLILAIDIDYGWFDNIRIQCADHSRIVDIIGYTTLISYKSMSSTLLNNFFYNKLSQCKTQ